jgi:hypothetical protein
MINKYVGACKINLEVGILAIQDKLKAEQANLNNLMHKLEKISSSFL